jgi:EAL domain-containing protein (putative c-di-GMP-specific phosphodiesterase class I)
MLSSTESAPADTASREEARADRFVAFSFAAAELLVETDLDGRIGFAAGAFRSRLGRDAACFEGCHLSSLFSPADHETLEMALAMVGYTGRIMPMVLHLADAGRTPQSVGAFLRQTQGQTARLSVSIGPLALQPVAARQQMGPLADKRGFARLAEQALRSGGSGGLGLVEVKGWDRLRESLSGDERRSLEHAMGDALTAINAASGHGGTASQLAEGRFGVVADSLDTEAVVARLEQALHANPAAGHTKVEGHSIVLSAGEMPTPQAARALRYALGRFADGGHAAMRDAGGEDGLAGIIASAEQHVAAMRAALEQRRFRLLYQPVVRLSDHAVKHYEALLRPHPSAGVPTREPQEFVTFCEAVGLSEQLDEAVLETAIAALQETREPSIAVNMSGLSLQNPAYGERLLARLGRLHNEGSRLAARRLLIELTETAEIADLPAAAATMEQLRAMGVPICLDDFGAGAAAFRYLRAFGVDYVKLDGDYVRSACKTPRDRALVGSMVEIASASGAKVIAEMIETEEQMKLMQDLGVAYGQGWLFGKPGRLPGSN